MAECFAGIAAGGGLAAKEAFKYNRENFLYDRILRRRKEFAVQNFRVDQAELWRKDVRDLISLTEYKMHVYLLVNVLLLGITVALWCQGKLPHTTPVWLMTGSALAMAGSFCFILLSIWLAMHAAISAQSFETRLLTQMVRLPIPTWQEIEACRTYASEFERLEARQMFRIPFAMGAQERMAPQTEDMEEDGNPDASPASSRRTDGGGREVPGHVDPWGLEGSGAELPELGCKIGHSMQKLRHVKLARQAMVFWQSYDAFARICMSIGVNQLLNAASYFILAYYMSEVKVPSSATYGVVVLTTMAETLNRLDMSLTWWQLRLMQLFLYLGPAIATLAGWAYVEDGYDRQAEALVVCAFLAHALYLTTMNTLCRMHMEHNGARLPVAFRSVLYLDVFGWSAAAQAHRHQTSDVASESRATFSEVGSERFSLTAATKPVLKPATGMVEYSGAGKPKPHRPEEMSAPNDYSRTPGAPYAQSFQDLVDGECSEFYNARSWLSTTSDLPEDSAVITGCEREAPVVLPQQTFSFAMNMLCFLWLSAAFYYAMDAAHILKRTSATYQQSENATSLLQGSSLLSPWAASFLEGGLREEHLTSKDMLTVTWPHENVLPQGLACDASAQHFLVSDGLTLYSAAIQEHSVGVPASASFDEAPCPPVLGQGLVDAALDCNGGRCEALVLHGHGKRLSSCRLGEDARGSYQADVSDAWLEEFRVGADAAAGQPHARVEKAMTLTADTWCGGHSAWEGCLLLGTSRGRVVRLAEKVGRNGRIAPVQALIERADKEFRAPGAVRAVGDQHFAVLASNGTRLHIHRKSDGLLQGNLTLDAAASGFCAGGDHLYFLDAGPSPRIWRLPVPQGLTGHIQAPGPWFELLRKPLKVIDGHSAL
mmetsp:Transcript_26158/g.60572  ORF Transcript_26158/g.60572 Transcript_26158/m.60572 type:complete len:883 (-) Transcript_26158:84-2732(-)